MTNFADRLRTLIGSDSVSAFSKKMEIGNTTIQNYVEGALPRIDKAVQIAAKADVSLEWLITGEGSMRKEAQSQHQSLVIRPPDALEGYAMVPQLDVQASAGGGVVVDHENAIGQIAFDPQWLRERHINPLGARVLTAKGDSMEPTIRNGDTLIVDTSIEVAVDSAIYVLVYGGSLLVKRIFMKRDGAIILSSDNQALYSINEEISAGEIDQLHIAGRVMWYGRAI